MSLTVRRALKLTAALAALGACGTGPRPRTLAPLREPNALEVNFVTPRCEPAGLPPSVQEVLAGAEPSEPQRPYWHLDGCFPVVLRAGGCDWACVGDRGGPCANGGSHQMLALVADGRVVGVTSVRGRGDPLFRRDLRIDVGPDGPRLTVQLLGGAAPPFGPPSGTFETYRWVRGGLELVGASDGLTLPSGQRKLGDLVYDLARR